jgi:hypothetical protein
MGAPRLADDKARPVVMETDLVEHAASDGWLHDAWIAGQLPRPELDTGARISIGAG